MFGKKKILSPEKLIAETGEQITKIVDTVFDGTITTDNDRLTKKNQLVGLLFNYLKSNVEPLVAELNGNKLQRNWRPIVALSFAFVVICANFIFPAINIWAESEKLAEFITNFNANERFWDVLEILIGGYVVGRSAEKITEVIAANVDLSFLKKKDRKEALKD